MKLTAHATFITLEAENDIENEIITNWGVMQPYYRGSGVRCIVDLPWDRTRTGNIHSINIAFSERKPE